MMTEKQREQCAKAIYPKIFSAAELIFKGSKAGSLTVPVAYALQEMPFARNILHQIEPIAGYTLKKEAINDFCEKTLNDIHDRHKRLYGMAKYISCIPYIHRLPKNMFVTAFELIAWGITEQLYKLRTEGKTNLPDNDKMLAVPTEVSAGKDENNTSVKINADTSHTL